MYSCNSTTWLRIWQYRTIMSYYSYVLLFLGRWSCFSWNSWESNRISIGTKIPSDGLTLIIRDPRMVLFLQSTDASPCEHLLKWKLTPENPPADAMFMAAMAMVFPCNIVEDFQSFVKNTKLWPSLKKSILQENGFKELTLVLSESLV